VRDGIVNVDHVEVVNARHIVQRHGQCKRIRRMLKERVVLHLYFVKEHPLAETL
jgi:hypothetical protein